MILNYRSDTFTKPTEEMRQAMATAEVGDDVYGEDPTVNELESYAADLVGKEAAVFLPTCTMANLIAVSVHCSKRFSEIILGNKQHIHLYEVGGISSLAGVHSQLLPNESDGTLSLEAIERSVREKDVHFPHTQLIAIENTHNASGGRVLRPDYLAALGALAQRKGLKVHMDGARIFNAATTLKLPVKEICKPVDSVSVCLSKGLCAPAGALLLGSKEFIGEARHARKAIGGAMRQSGVLAACGLIALKTMSLRLEEDHRHAKTLAAGLERINNGNNFFDILGGAHNVETNMFYFNVKDGKAGLVSEELKKFGIQIDNYGTSMMRIVTHNDVPISKAEYTLECFAKAAKTIFGN